MSIHDNISNSSQENIKFQRTSTPILSKRNIPDLHDTDFDVISGIFDTYGSIKNEVSCESSHENLDCEVEHLTDLKSRCNEISGEISKLSKSNESLDGKFIHFVNNMRNSANKLILKRLLGIYLNLWGVATENSLMISTTYAYPIQNYYANIMWSFTNHFM